METDRHTRIQFACWFSSLFLLAVRKLENEFWNLQKASREALFSTTCRLFCPRVSSLFW